MEFAELVRRFRAAAASGNGDALADLFVDDGVYNDHFFGPHTGRDAIKRMLAHFAPCLKPSLVSRLAPDRTALRSPCQLSPGPLLALLPA